MRPGRVPVPRSRYRGPGSTGCVPASPGRLQSPVGPGRGPLRLQGHYRGSTNGAANPGHSGPGPQNPRLCPGVDTGGYRKERYRPGTEVCRVGTRRYQWSSGVVPDGTGWEDVGRYRRVSREVLGWYRRAPGWYRRVLRRYRRGTRGTAEFWVLSAHPSPSRGPGPAPHGLSSSFQPAGDVPGAGARQQPPLFPSPRPGAPRGDRAGAGPRVTPPAPGTERDETGGTGDAEHRRYPDGHWA